MLDTPDDVNVVLVRGQRRSNHGVCHLPNPDDETRPSCDQQLRDDNADYNRVLVDRAPDSWRLCKFCDPDHDVKKGSTGQSLAAHIRDLATSGDLPDEVTRDAR